MFKRFFSLSVFKGIYSFLYNRMRLAIEYALIGSVIAIAAAAIALWYKTHSLEDENKNLYARVVSAEMINGAQDQTILQLKELREVDARMLAGLIQEYDKLTKADEEARQKITLLETRHENVRSFLDTPLPAELACVLNNTCTEDD